MKTKKVYIVTNPVGGMIAVCSSMKKTKDIITKDAVAHGIAIIHRNLYIVYPWTLT